MDDVLQCAARAVGALPVFAPHDELRDRGIHVGHTAIGGSIAPGGDHEPDDVADVLWRPLSQEPPSVVAELEAVNSRF